MTSEIRTAVDDCFLHDSDRLTHQEAIGILSSRIPPLTAVEEVSVELAAGRIVGASVSAQSDVPGHRNAAVDGYAFAFHDYDALNGGSFRVVGRAAAGHPMTQAVEAGDAARIFTGAPVPDAFDTVVMQEDVATSERDGAQYVAVPSGLKAGANVRAQGEDLLSGTDLLDQGQRLRPQDLAALASIGRKTVCCHRRPRVGLFSTGDEVIRPGAPLQHGQVYDANASMLPSLVALAGGGCVDLGVLPDERELVRDRIAAAATQFDLVMTSGGASLGEEDHIASVLDEVGTRHLWQIAVKPGRPMMFGQVGSSLFMGLPGNPVAVFVCFLLYGRPLLTRLGGGQWVEPKRYLVPAGFAIPRKKPDRREFWRGTMSTSDGKPVLHKFPKDGSGLITSLRDANGLIEVPEDVTSVSEGDLLAFIPYSEFGIV